MLLSHEHVGSKIPAKIQIYILTRAELLITLCYEIPCTSEIFGEFKVSLSLYQAMSSTYIFYYTKVIKSQLFFFSFKRMYLFWGQSLEALFYDFGNKM